ncbi:TSUP family transporter [Epidermidibacterium keratini]|uniref:Probable membrane transporter protein n=1 Tax=Epidermidibacterium keratini TaxID=1891644 RepID=A0A7L4YS32_9ACTN|nr:sulfite exporter TauE/SafE family protein [Epidermidibacterium keratini]QHC01367.1 TSUP family transporter [Epidermidibacterium keratini]
MTFADAVLIMLAGLGAGTINTIVGSGSLITFPTLLLLGFPPITANVSNNIGMVAGGLSGSWGYRSELTGARSMLLRLAPMSLIGGVTGALLLLVLPAEAFSAIVPVLIGFGLLMVIFGPRLQAWAARRHHETGTRPRWQQPVLQGGVLVTGAYGGYFGAAQGVILMGLLGTLAAGSLQKLNAIKNILALIVNAVAAVVFLIFAREQINWLLVLLISAGALLGGFVGASVGKRLAPNVLRAVIIVVGIVGIVKIVWFP